MDINALADDLIGVPYLCGGRAPKVGLDCWGVVVAVRSALGLPVEDILGYSEDWSARGEDHMRREIMDGPWSPVTTPEPADVALYATHRDGMVDHAGLVLDARWGLQQRRGALLSRYRLAAMGPMLVGYFRRVT